MPSDTRSMHEKLRSLRVEVRALGGCAPSALSTLAPKLAHALDVDGAFAFCVHEDDAGLRVGHGSECGVSGALRTLDALYRSREPASWLWLAPPRPGPSDRNRVRSREELEATQSPADAALCAELLERLGLGQVWLMRVAVCEGTEVLAHLVVFRRAPLGARHREALQSLVSALAERLSRDRAVAETSRSRDELRERLARFGAPAWIVSTTLDIEHANTAGHAQLERERTATLERIRAAIEAREDAAGLTLTPLARPGEPVAFLIVQR